MRATLKDIVAIVQDPDVAAEWAVMEPDVYYKEFAPYGLTALVRFRGRVYIATMTLHPTSPFTFGMLRDIMRVSRRESVVIITDDPKYHDKARRSLSKHGYTFRVENDILYSTKEK